MPVVSQVHGSEEYERRIKCFQNFSLHFTNEEMEAICLSLCRINIRTGTKILVP